MESNMELYSKEHILNKLCNRSLTENEHIEFKQQWEQSHGRHISAIGNKNKKGWLIIGVNDNGDLLDNQLDNLTNQKGKIENHVREYLKPSSTVLHISIENINNTKCIFIEIVDPGYPVAWNNKFYKRTGSQTSEMSSGEKKALELKRPGLDFSNLKYTGSINSSLVLDFVNFLPESNGDWTDSSVNNILSKLDIKNKNVSGILFGDFSFRVIHYKGEDEPLDQKEEKGLYRLLQNSFINQIQSWTRSKPITLKTGSLSMTEEEPYPYLVLREILVNAIAHSAFEKQHREIKVELYKNRIRVSNYCSLESAYLVNKKFSKEHFSHNPFLMKILRAANFSDDLGTGKNKIFKIMIESGRREPSFDCQKISNDYAILSVTLYNEQPNKNLLQLFDRFKKIYKNNADKYKISSALILWIDQTLEDILSYMDSYHQQLTWDILKDKKSPFLLISTKNQDNKVVPKILLKRWVKNQLEGQESKVFSQSEELDFKSILQEYSYMDNKKGFINNKEAREILGMSTDSQSEAVQLSKLFQKWERDGFVKKGSKRGDWKIQQKSEFSNIDTLKTLIKPSN